MSERQRVLVVGGYGGLGAVICEQFAEQGAAVAIAGRSFEKATELAEKLTRERRHRAAARDRRDRLGDDRRGGRRRWTRPGAASTCW